MRNSDHNSVLNDPKYMRLSAQLTWFFGLHSIKSLQKFVNAANKIEQQKNLEKSYSMQS